VVVVLEARIPCNGAVLDGRAASRRIPRLDEYAVTAVPETLIVCERDPDCILDVNALMAGFLDCAAVDRYISKAIPHRGDHVSIYRDAIIR
jgi:hypothetical protein